MITHPPYSNITPPQTLEYKYTSQRRYIQFDFLSQLQKTIQFSFFVYQKLRNSKLAAITEILTMAHNPIAKTQKFEATRITLTSTKPYEDVFTSLYASIGSPENVGAWPKIVKTVLSGPPNPQEQFTNTVQRVVGPHGFMIFQVSLSSPA